MRIAALLILVLTAQAAATAREWTVRIVSVLDRKASGEKARLIVSADGVSIERKNSPSVSIPTPSISEVIYRPSRYNRGEAMIEDSPPSGDPIQAAWTLASGAMLVSRASNHYIVVSWTDSGAARQQILEAGKKDYKSILAALEILTGRPAIDGTVATAVDGAPLLHSFDAGGGWRIPVRRGGDSRAPGMCFLVQHLHGLGGSGFNCVGELCVSETVVEYRPGPGSKPGHAFHAAPADLAGQQPAEARYYLTVKTSRKYGFALISRKGASARRETSKDSSAESWALFWRAVTGFPSVRKQLMLDQ